MKPAIIITGLLGLVACSSSTTTSTTQAPAPVVTEAPITLPPATSPIVPDFVNSEQFLVEFVSEQYPYTLYVTDQQIIDTGWATCNALDAGMDPTAIVAELLIAAEGDEKIALLLTIVTGGATGILCPEYVNVWDRG